MGLQLTYETFHEMRQSLRSHTPGDTEKRRQPRVGLRAQVEITVPGSIEFCKVWIRDISEGGVGLLAPIHIDPGTQFLMSLRDRDGVPHIIRCTVAHCRKVGTGLFVVGAVASRSAGD